MNRCARVQNLKDLLMICIGYIPQTFNKFLFNHGGRPLDNMLMHFHVFSLSFFFQERQKLVNDNVHPTFIFTIFKHEMYKWYLYMRYFKEHFGFYKPVTGF